jgi:hypothetical protein
MSYLLPPVGNSLQHTPLIHPIVLLLPSMSLKFLIDAYGALVIPYVLALHPPLSISNPKAHTDLVVFAFSTPTSVIQFLFVFTRGEGGVLSPPPCT